MAPTKSPESHEATNVSRNTLAKLLQERWNNRHATLVVDDTEHSTEFEEGESSDEQKKANAEMYEEFSRSRMAQFFQKSDQLAKEQRTEEIRRFSQPLHKEDKALWKKMPLIPDASGRRLLVRRGLAGDREKAAATFLDFFRNFHFGLWGYQQRPCPDQKPYDMQQVLGTRFLEKRFFDSTMRGSTWYYKDRLGRTRGPCEVTSLRTAWAAGVIDRNTFVWGDDMEEWAPVSMVYGLKQAIAPPDVQLAAAGYGLIHRVFNGLNPLRPFRGHEHQRQSLSQRQREALEDKRREGTVLRNYGNVWPALQTPSHALFLWASGGGLTRALNPQRSGMPDKFIPYETRKRLASVIPGLRPWEVLEVEQAFDWLSYHGMFFRSPLGTFATPPDYQEAYDESTREEWGEIKDALAAAFPELQQ